MTWQVDRAIALNGLGAQCERRARREPIYLPRQIVGNLSLLTARIFRWGNRVLLTNLPIDPSIAKVNCLPDLTGTFVVVRRKLMEVALRQSVQTGVGWGEELNLRSLARRDLRALGVRRECHRQVR